MRFLPSPSRALLTLSRCRISPIVKTTLAIRYPYWPLYITKHLKRKHRCSMNVFRSLHPPMASYGLTRRGFRILGILLLSSIGLLVYIRWHDILQAFLGPRLPPLYRKVRAREQSLPHYKGYEHQDVKYFFAANHAHSKSWNIMELVMST